MKVLVLGGAGMLGHKMVQVLSECVPETWCTVREAAGDPLVSRVPLFGAGRTIHGVDAMRLDRVDALLADLRPDVVVNCAGVIKQRDDARAAVPSITVNALLPHRLAAAAAAYGGRVIHFSTDCVFSGRRGDYRESDFPDAEDLYGRTKLLGEVAAENALTLRTSIIGRELRNHRSLLDWFLSSRGSVRGFRRVYWSGVTTLHLARLVARLIGEFPDLSGVWQVAGRKTSKYDLLLGIRDAYGRDVEILPDDEATLDRSLVDDRFREATGIETPGWDVLLPEMAGDPTPYDAWVVA